ncbi:hypothetical protein DB346_16355 [Verrucomicrobia bacterium LW23]|nr:hypothetical protein DB346_16355 [Verrucomicrobia bacterium LW23]
MARMDLVPSPRDAQRRPAARPPVTRPASVAPAPASAAAAKTPAPGHATAAFYHAPDSHEAPASPLKAAAGPVETPRSFGPAIGPATASFASNPTASGRLPKMFRDQTNGSGVTGSASAPPRADRERERIPTAEMPMPIFPPSEPASAAPPSAHPAAARGATPPPTRIPPRDDRAAPRDSDAGRQPTGGGRPPCCGGCDDHGHGEPNAGALVAGAGVQSAGAPPAGGAHGQRSWLGSNWLYSVAFGVPAMLFLMLGEWVMGWHGVTWFKWVSLILALEMLIIGGTKFYVGAWRQLMVGRATMDTLVSIGATAAYGLSLYGMIYPDRLHHLYFMETVAILALVSLGHWVEEIMSARATRSLDALMKLTPQTARRTRPDGSGEDVVPVATLQVGDLVLVKAGDAVPVDGDVTHGESTVDEQMLTGESVAVAKKVGSRVYGGTLNQFGALRVRVGAVGEATAIARITKMVRRAQQSRARIERLADQVSSWFVPVVIAIALVTLVSWGLLRGWEPAIINAIAVLIVACPCAMGLATPMALMAGINAAAARGILIRDGQAIEKAGAINTVLFDKTGTLTDREPQLEPPTYYVEEQLEAVSLAYGLAAPSHHPMSEAVCRLLHAQSPAPVDLENWQEQPGAGVSATWDGRVVRLGSLPWLRSCGVDLAPREGEGEGPATASELGVADEDQLVMSFPYRTRAATAVREVVHELEARGKALWLISGDTKENCLRLAEEAGLSAERVFAETRPDGKARFVTLLQSQGHRVAFIGDGINDGPALAQANLGIAVTGASDVARESADIVLVNASVAKVPEALKIAGDTLAVIRQNLFWAFIYNALAIPLAAFGLMSPILCALAMGLSDVCVVANSLRLLRK